MKTAVKGQNKLTVVYREISRFKEDIAMKLSTVITKSAPVKALGGLAVGALLITAVALPSEGVHADQYRYAPVTEKLVEAYDDHDLSFDDLVDYSSTPQQLLLTEAEIDDEVNPLGRFPNAVSVEQQRLMYRMEENESIRQALDFMEGGSWSLAVEDDRGSTDFEEAYVTDSPDIQRVLNTTELVAGNVPSDAWRFDSPFYDSFTGAGIQVESTFDPAIERLEREVAKLLSEVEHNPTANQQQLSREIERLEENIDMLHLMSFGD